ncbi:MAG: hypothetical protein HKN70_02100, partial [Gammaproteobacteria bacterium]|nr:hypothetical protein [Gammaproteobacteria bacterium]
TCTARAPCVSGASNASGAARATLGFATAFVRVQGSAQAPFNCGLPQVVLNANVSYYVNIALAVEPPGGWPGGPVPLIVRGRLTANEESIGGSAASLTINGPGVSATWAANSQDQPDLIVVAELGMSFDEFYVVSLNASCIAGVGFAGGIDTCEATSDPTFEFDQATFDAMMGADTFPLTDYLAIENSENLVATPLAVDVVKLTNFNRADGAYDTNVPRIPAGETVTWTYDVSNLGETAIAATDLLVTDTDPVVIPILDTATDDGDLILSPLETWEYTASVPALDLATSPPGVTIVTGCGDGRNTYENTGRAEIAGEGIFDEHMSHYCNDVAVLDGDGDGIRDEQDNCIEIPNGPVILDAGGQSQRDTDGDGYGNVCDPDLDNNGVVNFLDVSLWVPFFNTATTGDADFTGDGFSNFVDYAIFPEFFLLPPGPSGVVP